MTVIGLTGPTGSGKSTLCKIAAEIGMSVFDGLVCLVVAH